MLNDSNGLLVRHTGQLARDLNDLVDRMRRSTSDAMARAVAGLVNSVVQSVLGGKPERAENPQDYPFRRRMHPWQDHDDPSWPFKSLQDRHEVDERDWQDRDDDLEEDIDPVATHEPDVGLIRQRWLAAVLAGVQAVIWSLRRQPTKRSLLAVLGIGTAAGVAALALGGVTGPVAALLALLETLFAGAALLRP